MTRKEYLESLGFHYHDYDNTWIKGYYDENDIVYVLDYYTEKYRLDLNDYVVISKEDINVLYESLEWLKNIYEKSLEYPE